MKSIKKLKYICLVAIGIGWMSCDDMFNPDLDNAYGEERAEYHPQTALGFLNTAYLALPESYDFSECATDDAVINDPLSSFPQMVGGSWGPLFDPLSIWSSSYKAIMNVNQFIVYIPKVVISWQDAEDDAAYRKRWTGEAHGIRAYHHFLLLKYYGGKGTSGKQLGVPYLKELVDINSGDWKNIERPSYSSTVDNISKDLDIAIANLPMDYTGTDRVVGVRNSNRFSIRIAYAAKAQLYMHAASPAYNDGVYNKAYCDSVMKYSALLIDNIGGLTGLGSISNTQFFTSDTPPADVLWRMNQTTEATTESAMANTIESKNYPPSRSGKGQVNPTQDFVDAFPAINGYPITDSRSLYDPTKPYLSRDSRLDLTVVRDGGKLGSYTINTAKEDTKNGIENQGATRTGYYLKKLLRPDFSITNPIAGKKTIRPLIRYTEMYLIFAEAAAAAYGADTKGKYGNYTAREVIKAIRQRAGISVADEYATNLSSTVFMDLIRNERRLELSFEGYRFSDLRRWQLNLNGIVKRARILTNGGIPEFLPINDEPRIFSTFKNYSPIPNSEILKCPKIEQNSQN